MTTQEKVIDIIATQLGIEDTSSINLDTDIANDLGADSLDIAELMIAFEDQFDIDIDEDKAQSIATVGQVVEQIDALLNGEGAKDATTPASTKADEKEDIH